MPGTDSFVARDSSGQIGWLTQIRFQPMFSEFLEAATAKYWYQRIEPVEVDEGEVELLAAELERRLKR